MRSIITLRSNTTRRKANKTEKTTSFEVVFSGGDGEDRTLDLLNAIQALSQYTQKHTPYLFGDALEFMFSVTTIMSPCFMLVTDNLPITKFCYMLLV